MLSPDAADVDMAADAPMQFFGILHNGQVVATSMLLLADGLAGIYCVATRPEKRCQGLGARITAEALQAAQRLGYRVGVLQATEEGQPVYRSLGFQTFGEIAMYLRLPN